MKNSKKTLVIAFILIAMVATMAIGFVGCGGTNLDGVYKDDSGTAFVLKISADTIQRIYNLGENNEDIIGTTTFTKDKDKLVFAEGKIGSIFEITLLENGKLQTKSIAVNGTEIIATYTKVTDKK